MTKKELIDWTHNILDPSGSSHRFHPKQIEYAIEKAYNQYVQSIPSYLYDEYEFWVKEYTGQTTVLDATRGLYYLAYEASIRGGKAYCRRRGNTSHGLYTLR